MFILSTDSIQEYKVTNAIFINDDKEGYIGTVTTKMGQYESYQVRQKIAREGKEDYLKKTKEDYSEAVTMSGIEINNLNDYEEPVILKYNVALDTKDNLLYVSPIFGEAYKENLFKATERHYPVEMPFKLNEIYIMRMEIPKGYAIEEIPKSSRVNLNEDEGMFEYMISKDENAIMLRSTVRLNKANFETEDYQTLRDFFAYVVKKHSEQIVLKKIK